MIWTLAWNTVQAEWNMQGYWGRYKRQGVVRPQCDTISVLFGWWHVSFYNRQTWLLIIFQARHLLRLLSLNSTAGIQQLGFWILWTYFRRWKYFRDRLFASFMTMGVGNRGFILWRGDARWRERGFLLPRLQRGCCQHALMILFTWHWVCWTFDIFKLVCS